MGENVSKITEVSSLKVRVFSKGIRGQWPNFTTLLSSWYSQAHVSIDKCGTLYLKHKTECTQYQSNIRGKGQLNAGTSTGIVSWVVLILSFWMNIHYWNVSQSVLNLKKVTLKDLCFCPWNSWTEGPWCSLNDGLKVICIRIFWEKRESSDFHIPPQNYWIKKTIEPRLFQNICNFTST